jgi:hypothetical protein
VGANKRKWNNPDFTSETKGVQDLCSNLVASEAGLGHAVIMLEKCQEIFLQ